MAKIGKQFKGASKEKGAKKGKLTDEEKRMREELERLMAEERARKEQERRRKQLKDKRGREEACSKINRLKITNQWRKIMRLAKVEDLRKEIEILSQGHERLVDRKDAFIQMLDKDQEEAEEQYQMAQRGYIMVMDKLLEIHEQRTKALRREFEKDLEELKREFDAERQEIGLKHNLRKKELLDVMTLMEKQHGEVEDEARQETDGQREEIKNRNAEEYNMLRDTLERVIKRIEEDFDTAHANYLANTEARTQEFKALTTRDQQSAKTIDTQTRRIQRLQDSIGHWRAKLAQNARECEERNRALREEKDAIARHYQDLKGRMARFRDGEGKRLQSLTLNARAAVKDLKDQLTKAENILKLAELNRKLETEREKVRPQAAVGLARPPHTSRVPSGVVAASRRCSPSTTRLGPQRKRPRRRRWCTTRPRRSRRLRPSGMAGRWASGSTSTISSRSTTRCCSMI